MIAEASCFTNLNRLGQSSSCEKRTALPGASEIPANAGGGQPNEKVPGTQRHRNVPLSEHFMHRTGMGRHAESEIENARPDPQADVSREERLEDCGEHQAAAHGIPDQRTKE